MATNELDAQLAAENAAMYEKDKNPAAGEMLDNDVLNKFKKQDKAKKLVAWVKDEYSKCKNGRRSEEND